MRTIIEQLKEIIKKEGLTVRQIAEKSGTYHPQIVRILNEKNSPSIRLFEKICNSLGIRIILKKK